MANTGVQEQGDAMEQAKSARLNGWQRLLIALALIAILPAVGLIVADWESADAWVRDLQQLPPNRVAIEGAGDVDFPATMSSEAIDLVVGAAAGKPEAVRAGITAWTAEFNNVLRAFIADLNRALVIRIAAFWAGGVALLYGIGWLIAWVRRGFKP